MKIKFTGKRSLTLSLTRKQLDTIFAALDSAGCCAAENEGSAYKDVPILERMLSSALVRAKLGVK